MQKQQDNNGKRSVRIAISNYAILALASILLLDVPYASAIERVEDAVVAIGQGVATNFYYSELATNAVNPVGEARVAGVPLGMASIRRGTTSMDHEKISYTAPADWLGEEEIRYRLADDANNFKYGKIVIRVVEENNGKSVR